MRCLHCRKKIGLLRRWVDRQFCSDNHRRKARQAYSARLTRDMVHDEAFEDAWLVTLNSPRKQKGTGFGAGSGILLVVAATVLVLFLPSSEQQVQTSVPSYLPPVRNWSDKLTRLMPGSAKLSMREDFKVDLRNWQAEAQAGAQEWSRLSGAVRLGDMRLWKPTLSLSDYQMSFEGQIENKAMGWTFRTTNFSNFYATKINIANPGRAEIIRYITLEGKQLNRVALPIPLSIASDTIYDVHVRVKGNRFSTVVNGRLVDSWADNRLKRGGIGFFNDPGERANLRWVTISERESFLDRFLTFGLLYTPMDITNGNF